MGPVKLLASRREPAAGDTGDEWTYLACCSKCARHMLQVSIGGRRRGRNAGAAPRRSSRRFCSDLGSTVFIIIIVVVVTKVNEVDDVT